MLLLKQLISLLPLNFDPKTETFIGDEEANKYLTRPARKPFEVPDKV
jgi:hypothetical protein